MGIMCLALSQEACPKGTEPSQDGTQCVCKVTGSIMVDGKCECRPGNVWNADAGECTCPKGTEPSQDGTQCVCKVTGSIMVDGKCECRPEYVWNKDAGECTPSAST